MRGASGEGEKKGMGGASGRKRGSRSEERRRLEKEEDGEGGEE